MTGGRVHLRSMQAHTLARMRLPYAASNTDTPHCVLPESAAQIKAANGPAAAFNTVNMNAAWLNRCDGD